MLQDRRTDRSDDVSRAPSREARQARTVRKQTSKPAGSRRRASCFPVPRHPVLGMTR